jgi:hypothetical protein
MRSLSKRSFLCACAIVAACTLSGSATGRTVSGARSTATTSYDNALIADKALSYLNQWGGEACRDAHKLDHNNKGTTVAGYGGGQCRTFVNCILFLVSGGKQYPTGTYFQSFLDAGGVEIKSIDDLVKGDIVQSGDGVHTFIIVSRVKGSTFTVVDSNNAYNEKVSEHSRVVTLSSTIRAFRMGSTSHNLVPAMNTIVTTPQGTSYFYDGRLHWIPDAETYWCLRNVQHRAVITAQQSDVDRLGNGQPWVSPCFDPSRVIGHVVREGGGTAYYVTSGGPLAAGGTLWHWIPDSATYNCLVSSGITVIQSNWTQINTLRGASGQNEGPQAICSTGGGAPTITSIPDITIDPTDSASYPARVNYRDDDCDVVGGTWLDASGVSHEFSNASDASHPGGCTGGIGYLTPGFSGCTSPDGRHSAPARYAQTITIRDKLGNVSAPFVFYVVCR